MEYFTPAEIVIYIFSTFSLLEERRVVHCLGEGSFCLFEEHQLQDRRHGCSRSSRPWNGESWDAVAAIALLLFLFSSGCTKLHVTDYELRMVSVSAAKWFLFPA